MNGHQLQQNYRPIKRNGRFLFEYDPRRQLVRIKRGGETFVVDLTEELAFEISMTKNEAAPIKKASNGGGFSGSRFGG